MSHPTAHPAVVKFGEQYGIDPALVPRVLRETAFQADEPASESQILALLTVCHEYGLNPFTREVWAYPDKKRGIIPVVSIDGWVRIMNAHPAFEGVEFAFSDTMVDLQDAKPAPHWCEVTIYRKDRAKPIQIREWLDEVYRPPHQGKSKDGRPYKTSGPHQTHPKRMLRHKTLIQGLRVGLGLVGIFDQDEAERILEGQEPEATPTEAISTAPTRPTAKVLQHPTAPQESAPPVQPESTAVSVQSPEDIQKEAEQRIRDLKEEIAHPPAEFGDEQASLLAKVIQKTRQTGSWKTIIQWIPTVAPFLGNPEATRHAVAVLELESMAHRPPAPAPEPESKRSPAVAEELGKARSAVAGKG